MGNKQTIALLLTLFVTFLMLGAGISAQEAQAVTPPVGGIVTAENFMEGVAAKYSTFKDYEAKITIKSGDSDMSGTVSYRSPVFLRIDFTSPAEQVIVFNGEMLTVYLPNPYRAILTQSVPQGSSGAAGGAGLATGDGLNLLRRNYASAFVVGPDPVPLDETGPTSRELVVKVRMTRRYGTEGFQEIIISVNPTTLLIRRMAATTVAGNLVRFDFYDVKTNIGIPELRFVYDSPASANVYDNFLFRDTQ